MNTISKLISKKTDFKSKYDFKHRKNESERITIKYPDRIPCILERSGKNIPLVNKTKYLIPRDLTVGQFIYVVRKRLKLDSSLAIFLFFNDNILVNSSETINYCYLNYKDDDGFLYIKYSGENTFG
tara:strand:+ start:1257 stop:1634 length:378 start_codon:yes stop_codon:yes gene_type:complete